MQPANTAREEMFGKEAPVWPFLKRFGGPADPLEPIANTRVFETYPVIALGWILPDSRCGSPAQVQSGKKATRITSGVAAQKRLVALILDSRV
jgi:hypothetical protein